MDYFGDYKETTRDYIGDYKETTREYTGDYKETTVRRVGQQHSTMRSSPSIGRHSLPLPDSTCCKV